MTLSWTLDKVGPLARTAEDCAIVMDAIAGHGRHSHYAAASAQEAARPVTVAISASELDECSPAIRGALIRGIDEFRRLYPSVVETEIHRGPRYITHLEDLVRAEGAFGLRAYLRDPEFKMSDQRQLETLRSGLTLATETYLEAKRLGVGAAQSAFRAVFAQADVILSASRTGVAPDLNAERPPRDASKMSDLLRAAGNLAGVPGVSFPCGLSEDGMPVGLQLVGPRGSDALLLGMAAAYQRSTEHHLLRPPAVVAASP
jgi:aspartyl-tRNA(Asn)/glutamyl-tRNA(Gln) amidotransferase subunit A